MTDEKHGTIVAVVGAGTMGGGIAQVAAAAGHRVLLLDADPSALERARGQLVRVLSRLEEKGRLGDGESERILARISPVSELRELRAAGLVIEAIVERLDAKQQLLRELEPHVGDKCLLATNTSSLPVAAIAAACRVPGRCLGAHFFNPAPLMPLVEIVPGLATDAAAVDNARALVDGWGKTTVIARDTPGFIVNRIARPFYGEALRIIEEGIADAATIDWAMKELGGFRMGPFELMDLIGNDVNYTVTETVFEAFFFDPRYKPSFFQQRMVQAGRLGRKSGRGHYDYAPGAVLPEPSRDEETGRRVFDRIVAMLINEAADALFWRVATARDIELAMTRGVNYPRGLLEWANEIGPAEVLDRLVRLQQEYGEDRYRPSPLLRKMAESGGRFDVRGE
jgi:3-hydroxybutyryl-CoA dehydrogenase